VSANFRLAARSCLKKGGVYIVVSCWASLGAAGSDRADRRENAADRIQRQRR
jgi:hypothetical protein